MTDVLFFVVFGAATAFFVLCGVWVAVLIWFFVKVARDDDCGCCDDAQGGVDMTDTNCLVAAGLHKPQARDLCAYMNRACGKAEVLVFVAEVREGGRPIDWVVVSQKLAGRPLGAAAKMSHRDIARAWLAGNGVPKHIMAWLLHQWLGGVPADVLTPDLVLAQISVLHGGPDTTYHQLLCARCPDYAQKYGDKKEQGADNDKED